MKREVAQYIVECDICKKVKADHLRSAGPLQPLSMPSWKWEGISMDFIVGLPTTAVSEPPSLIQFIHANPSSQLVRTNHAHKTD